MDVIRMVHIGARVYGFIGCQCILDELAVSVGMIHFVLQDSAFSVTPVFGFLPVMGHRNNLNNISIDAIDQSIAKTFEVTASQCFAHGMPGVRKFQDQSSCLRDFKQEAFAQAGFL